MMSLIVCTLQRTRELARLLASLERQTDKRFEVIVVDQNAPGILEPVLAAAPGLQVRRVMSAKGLSRARNTGLSKARFGLVAFPDDDCWYPPTLVGDVITAFQNAPGIDVMIGRTADAQGRDSLSVSAVVSGTVTRPRIFETGNSNAIFVRTAMARTCGGFDETLGVGAGTPYGSGEETEFLLRCLRHGARIEARCEMLVHHEQVVRDPSRLTAYARGFGRVCRLHGLGARTMAPRLARAALRSVALAATGRGGEARERWTWIAGSISGFLARRRATTRPPSGSVQ